MPIPPQPTIDPAPIRTAILRPDKTNLLSNTYEKWFTQIYRALLGLLSQLAPALVNWGGDASGTNDSSAGLNSIIQAAIANGQPTAIYAPAGTYLLSSPVIFPSNCPAIQLYGDGEATKFLRNGNMPIGQGMFDVQGCADIDFRDFAVDGQVTSPVGVNYSSVAGNPMQPFLTQNTSFWIHGGSKRIRWVRISIRHTGGYARLIDPVNSGIRDVRIIDCLNENNRPHLFGTDNSDLNYGSWTGGDYVNGNGQNPGQNQVLRDFLVQGTTYRRNTGNCLWSHLFDLKELHSDFRFLGNSFEDMGLDGILVGGVSGGTVEGNVFHRIGFITNSDTDIPTPKWLPAKNAVALDSAGIVKGVCYKGNAFTSVNGGCMDLDGHSDGAITGNICRIPYSFEPEYTEDRIADFGPAGVGNATYGLQVSNSNNDQTAGSNMEISGNQFINIPNGSIKLFATRDTHVIANNIIVPDTPIYPPVSIGNIGPGDFQRGYNNVVNHNRFSNSSAAPCVFEDPNGTPFDPSDQNWVFGNRVIGGAVEFQKDSGTASVVYAETVWFP